MHREFLARSLNINLLLHLEKLGLAMRGDLAGANCALPWLSHGS